MNSKLQPYQPLRALTSDLFVVDGEWEETAFGRRMTIVRLKDGSLVIHSAIAMEEKDMAALEKLGPIGTIVVPNAFHDSEAPFYAKRYPQAKVYVPAKLRARSEKRMRVDGTIEKDWPHNTELPRITFENSVACESVFVHHASRTLILTDMSFNVASEDFKNPIEKLIFGKWNGILDQFGPSRLTKLAIARDRVAVARALKQIASHEFDRVILSHGRIVEGDGKRRFLDGYARVYGPL